MRQHVETKAEARQRLVAEYRAADEQWPTDLLSIARWALNNGRLDYQPISRERLLAREIREALREEVYTDPQGRRVRKKHAFPEEVPYMDGYVQKTFWCDIETAEPEQMEKAFAWRRRLIVGDSKQLRTDVDSYNENNPYGAWIQLSLNFEPDIAELQQDTEYNPPPPPDADLDEEDDKSDS